MKTKHVCLAMTPDKGTACGRTAVWILLGCNGDHPVYACSRHLNVVAERVAERVAMVVGREITMRKLEA